MLYIAIKQMKAFIYKIERLKGVKNMNNKQMILNELIYLAYERNVKVKLLNEYIKKVSRCQDYNKMVEIYREFSKVTA